MLTTDNPALYTDFNSLSKLKLEAKNQSPQAVEKVAKQFESLFINMMIKSMRQANLGDGMLETQQSEMYRDMYDQQIALTMAEKPGKSGIGIADFIIKQMAPKTKTDADPQSPENEAAVPENPQFAVPKRQNINNRAMKMIDASGLSSLGETLSALESDQQELNGRWESIDDEWQGQKLISGKQSGVKTDFISQLLPHARSAAQELGVDVNLLLAQAALETGWGQGIIKNNNGGSSYNLFNIKADKSWQGKQAKAVTLEFEDGVTKKQLSGFRAYASFKESFDDYVDFMKSNPRYAEAVKKAGNPAKYIHELQQAGYATDPKYAEKVMTIYINQLAENARIPVGPG